MEVPILSFVTHKANTVSQKIDSPTSSSTYWNQIIADNDLLDIMLN